MKTYAMWSKITLPALLLAFLSLSQTACVLPPECNPESSVFDPEDCLDETPPGVILALLTKAAYGSEDTSDPLASKCPVSLFCSPTNCIFVVENGSFEKGLGIAPWTGDSANKTSFSCNPSSESLYFRATTPEGASPRISSQVFQVIDYSALVPEAARNVMRRVRAQAAFQVRDTGFIDRLFGLRIEAYYGDISTFPQSGDPEQIPRETSTYQLLGFSEEIFLFDFEGASWQPLRTQLMLPPDSTAFLVVILEAREDAINDTDTGEFPNFQAVDAVQVVIDAGPYPPTARSDEASTRRDEPVDINVLFNDLDPDDLLDPTTVRVVVQPQHGTATANADGTITYTPENGYTGTDQFSYSFFDRDGFTAGALVSIVVLPTNRSPLAVDDSFDVLEGTPTVLDLLTNDSDPDGDPIRIIAVGLRDKVEIINNGQAVRFTPSAGFTGTEAFAYIIADDKGAMSNEAEVTVNVVPRIRPNQAPTVTNAINDMMVNVDPPGVCSFDLNNHFSDPDGDPLIYTHTLTNNAATVAINGSMITITGFSSGQTTVTVTAQDPGGLNARDTFSVSAMFGATNCGGNNLAQ